MAERPGDLGLLGSLDLGKFVESLPDALFVVDRTGLIQLVNSQAESLFGYPKAQLLGMSIDMLVPEAVRDSHPAHRSAYCADPKSRPMGAGLELSGRHRDGTLFPIDISLSSIQTEHGLLVTAAVRDITERKKLEAKFQALLESAPDAVVGVDSEGVIRLANRQAEALFGYRREEMLGQPIEILVPERVKGIHPAHRAGYFADPRTRPMGAGLALSARRKDGTEFPVDISLSSIDTGDGILVSAAVRDITDRLEAQAEREAIEQRLHQAARRELEAFSYTVSHDLRAPIRAIHGFARILQTEHGGEMSPEANGYVDLVITNASELGSLIDGLLKFFRLGRQTLNRQWVDPGQIAIRVAEKINVALKGPHFELVAGDLPKCWADPILVENVFWNLIGNAAKFTRDRERPRVEIGSTTGSQEGETVYYVRDNGVGFDIKYADKIFGVFQRLRSGDREDGTGAGLAIVKRIVQRHGGRIWAEADLGTGATFYFTLGSSDDGGSSPPAQDAAL